MIDTAGQDLARRAGSWLRVLAGSSRLDRFMLVVTLLGLPTAAWLCLQVRTFDTDQLGLVGLLIAVVLLSELLPIQMVRRGRKSDDITISSAFALALVLVAPLSIAVLAQSLPVVVDDLRKGKSWYRASFNVAQYTLTFCASRLVFSLLGSQEFLNPEPFARADLLPAFAAGVVFFVVNHALVGTAVALWSGDRVLPHLLDDIRFQASINGVLVCLAPAVLVVSEFSLLLLPVLVLPVAAVRKSAKLATQRDHDALHDPLTGLPNRALLHLDAETALRDAVRDGRGVAVMLIDLDHFKEINDTLGHNVGDLLIVEVGRRLSHAAGDDAIVARLGGDEFAVLAAPDVAASELERVTEALVERLSRTLREPMTLAGVRLDVQGSIGIAYAPQHAHGMDELLSRADVAMYSAKEERGSWRTYDPEQDQHTPERLALLGELREGLRRGELVLHYQPKCEARRGGLIGAEALVRWEHPVRGLLMPDEFIPLAENTGLITDLTLEVLEQAVRQVREWTRSGRCFGVAVNLSVRHLTDLDLPVRVGETLARHGVAPHLLTLEVTESTIMNDPSRAVNVISRLRELGVRIAVDDYGTGYSSLAYLKRLHVDELKIDKSFIINMLADDNDEVIVRSTVELGHNLGLQVVAEGVEDAEVWQRLLPLGCDVIQGYHLSRALAAEPFTAWCDGWQAALSRTDRSRTDLPRRLDAVRSGLPQPRSTGPSADGLGVLPLDAPATGSTQVSGRGGARTPEAPPC
ncbi:MAG: EAL domain-containing protein [Actinomycetota bacterium]|nr:EAL domain-containing protein [Actinomycetota bacterium]